VFTDALILGKPANLSIRLTLCEPVKINGDKHRLRQLLLNLAENAVKYNQPGGSIDFSLQRTEENARLEISNTSKNIQPEILPRVFERFFRGDPSHGSTVEGCGLGLSIAQWIVTAHSGDIAITSAENMTRVRVRLPSAGGVP
jgi:signal transduction histidine kinase